MGARRIGWLAGHGAAARGCVSALLLGVAGPAFGQTCDYMARPAAAEALRYLGEGAVVQAWCAPCRERRARKIVVDDAEAQDIDTYYVRVLVNGAPVDPAYLYVLDPRRRRFVNLGLLVACHEEDDVPPTLPADKVDP